MNYFDLQNKTVFFTKIALLFAFAILCFISPEAVAQSLPTPPDGMGGGTDGDWMKSIGKIAYRGGVLVVILIAVAAAIACGYYVLTVINNIRTGKADLGALVVAVLIAVVGLAVTGIFTYYALDILEDNKSFLEGG